MGVGTPHRGMKRWGENKEFVEEIRGYCCALHTKYSMSHCLYLGDCTQTHATKFVVTAQFCNSISMYTYFNLPLEVWPLPLILQSLSPASLTPTP